MPELPEVETLRTSLEAWLPGARLRGLRCGRKRLRHPLPRSRLQATVGHRVLGLRRRGKVLHLDFDGPGAGWTVLVHLGMSGRLLRDSGRPSWQDHEHLRWSFDRGLLRFIDPRRFGSVEIAAAAEVSDHPRVASLGPEPLSDAFDGAHLYAASRGRRLALRDLLLDGRVVAGVGNIYANEACFCAGLRPGRAARRMTRASAARLADCVKGVLSRAIEAGGTTLSDGGYVDGEGRSGWFQIQVGVYGRDGKPCPRCAATVRRRLLGQRSAFYCPACQD
jgi:formamidopyrimidine-DNA glycosylase